VQRVARGGEKPQNRPLSNLNAGALIALRAMLPVITRHLENDKKVDTVSMEGEAEVVRAADIAEP